MSQSSDGAKGVPDGAPSVGSRIAEANRGLVSAENDLKALSAKRLAALKQMPASRVARLDMASELTAADQRELRAWLADRTKASDPEAPSPRPWRRGGRRGGRKLPELRTMMAGGVGVLVLLAVAIGWARTPENYQVLRSTTDITILAADGSLQRITLPGGTVVIRDREDLTRRMFEGRYWVRGEGYRPITVTLGS